MRVPTDSSEGFRGRLTPRTLSVTLGAFLCGAALILPVTGVRAADSELVPDTVVIVDRSARFGVLDDVDSESGVTWFSFGGASDIPVYGDWNCDGADSPGVFRPASAEFLLRNGSGSGAEDIRFYFGDVGDVPLVGDFDGDGCDTVGVYRPATAKVYLTNQLKAGPPDREFYVGEVGDEAADLRNSASIPEETGPTGLITADESFDGLRGGHDGVLRGDRTGAVPAGRSHRGQWAPIARR